MPTQPPEFEDEIEDTGDEIDTGVEDLSQTDGAAVEPVPFQPRPSQPSAAPAAPDLDARRAEIRKIVDERAKAAWDKAHPFTPSGWQPKLNERTYQAAEKSFDEADRKQAMVERAAEIERRREELAQKKQYNADFLKESDVTGVRARVNPVTGVYEPIRDAEGRAQFKQTAWKVTAHPASKLPVLARRGATGQTEFKRPTLKLHPEDALDEYIYADAGDGESIPYMKAAEALQSKDISLQKLGVQHQRRSNTARRRMEIEAPKAMLESANLKVQTLKGEIDFLEGENQADDAASAALDATTQQLGGGFLGIGQSPTPEALAAMSQRDQIMQRRIARSTQIDALKAQVAPGGPAHREQTLAKMNLDVIGPTHIRDEYADQEREILTRLESQGIDPNTDPAFIANRKALLAADAAVKGATAARDRWTALMAAKDKGAVPVPQAQAEQQPGVMQTIGNLAKDIPLGIAKGVIGMGEAAVGLANIPTLGAAGEAMESIGYKPQEAKQILTGMQSPQLQKAQSNVAAAKGFMPTVAALAQNPTALIDTAAESVPSMVGGAGIGVGVAKTLGNAALIKAARILSKTGIQVSPNVIAASIGEGAVIAGSQAEQTRQETGDLTVKQAALASAAGVIGSALGLAGGAAARKLGVADIDELLVAGKVTPSQASAIKQVIGGAFSEGVLEELPQSAVEQVASNMSTGKPWNQGVAEAAASGMAVGGIMGGAGGAVSALGGKPPPDGGTPAKPGVTPTDTGGSPVGAPAKPAPVDDAATAAARATIAQSLFGEAAIAPQPPPEAPPAAGTAPAPQPGPAGPNAPVAPSGETPAPTPATPSGTKVSTPETPISQGVVTTPEAPAPATSEPTVPAMAETPPTAPAAAPEAAQAPISKPAPATFVGMQQFGDQPGPQDFEIFNLTEDIEGHPAGSTVSRKTLEEAGYTVPPRPATTPAPEQPATPEVIEGEKINKEWTAFSAESGSLGIPRTEMPQVKSEARGALVNFLKARGVAAKAEQINPSDLKPTQAEFSPAKVDKARNFEGSERPILVSADNHVVDGHHQWVAALDNPEAKIPVIRLQAPIQDVIAAVKEFPSATTAKGATTTTQPAQPNAQPAEEVVQEVKAAPPVPERGAGNEAPRAVGEQPVGDAGVAPPAPVVPEVAPATPAAEAEPAAPPTADIEEANVPAAPAAEPIDATEAKFEEAVPVAEGSSPNKLMRAVSRVRAIDRELASAGSGKKRKELLLERLQVMAEQGHAPSKTALEKHAAKEAAGAGIHEIVRNVVKKLGIKSDQGALSGEAKMLKESLPKSYVNKNGLAFDALKEAIVGDAEAAGVPYTPGKDIPTLIRLAFDKRNQGTEPEIVDVPGIQKPRKNEAQLVPPEGEALVLRPETVKAPESAVATAEAKAAAEAEAKKQTDMFGAGEESAKAPTGLSSDLAARLLALPTEARTFPMGDQNAALRQDILEALTGKRPAKSKAGASVVREALRDYMEATTDEEVEAGLQRIVGDKASLSDAAPQAASPSAQADLAAWQKANPQAPKVELIHDPNWTQNGRGVKGMYRDGKLVINSAYATDIAAIANHEWSHSTLASEKGKVALATFATREIPAADMAKLAQKYPRKEGQSLVDHRLELVEEWVATNAEKSPGVWQRIVEAVRGWLARQGLATLTNEEAARAMIRSLRGEAAMQGQARFAQTDEKVPAEPKTKESLVSKQLRERGYTTEEIRYLVRNQEEVWADAESLVAKHGATKVEELVRNRTIKGDVRGAIVGVLMTSVKNDAMQMNRLQRLLQENVSTESGQAIAMHAKIYEKLGGAQSTITEFARNVVSEQKDKIAPKFTPETVNEVSAGIDTAGKEASEAMNEILTKSQYKSPVGTEPGAKGTATDAEVAAGMADALTNPAFRGQNEAVAKDLLAKHTWVLGLMRDAGRKLGVNWSDLFQSMPQNQEARQAELYDRIKAHPKLQNLTDAQKKILADELGKAWGELRDNIFRAEFKRLVPLPKVAEVDKAKVEGVAGKLLRYSNLGLLDNVAFLNALAEKYGLNSMDGKVADRMKELANQIQSAKTEAERARLTRELLREYHKAKGTSVVDYLQSLMYANILSGPTTLIGGMALPNTINSMWQLATMAAANPKRSKTLLKGYAAGWDDGWNQFKSVLATGHGGQDPAALQAESRGDTLEMLAMGDAFPKLKAMSPAGYSVLQKHAQALRYVPRMVRAIDQLAYYPAKEAYTWVATEMLLRSQYSGQQLHDKIQETLGVRPGDFAKFKKQAEAEGFTGHDLSRRISDLIETFRQKSAVGEQAVEEGKRFGMSTTLSAEPEGWAGVVYHHVTKMIQDVSPNGVPVLKPFFLFLRVPTNFYNLTLNATPWGAIKAQQGRVATQQKKSGKRVYRQLGEDEKHQLYMQSVIGTALMGFLAVKALEGDDDDPFITAEGNPDPQARKQAIANGWMPNSIRLPGSDVRVSFQNWPIAMPLAIVGRVADSVRYEKRPDKELLERVTEAIMKAPSVVFGAPVLQGLTQLAELTNPYRTNVEKSKRFLASIPTSMVMPRLVKQVGAVFDDTVKDDGVVRYDSLGEPVRWNPAGRMITVQDKTPLRAWLNKARITVPVPGRDVKIDGNPYTLTNEEFYTLERLAGTATRVKLEGQLGSLRALPRDKAEEQVRKIANDELQRVRSMMRPMMKMNIAKKAAQK